MLSYLKSRRDYFIILGIVLLCVFPLFKMEFSTDTYKAYTIGLGGVAKTMFLNGRYVTGLFALAFYNMNASIENFYYASFVLSFIFMSLAIYALFTVLRDNMSKRLSLFISFISVFNVCAIEYFLFIEKGAFCFSILMAILALKYFVLFLQGKKIYLFLSFICLILSSITYQIIPGIFITLALPFIIKYSKSVRTFVINNLFAALIYGSGTGIDYLIVKLTQDNTRVGSGVHLSNIIKFYSFCTNNFAFIFLYIGLIGASLGIFALVNKKRSGKYLTKDSFLVYAKYFYIILGTMAVTVLPFVFTDPNEVWIMFRVIYPFGALPGAILIMKSYKKDYEVKEEAKGKINKKAIILLSFLLVHIVFFQAMVFSRLKNNDADYQQFEAIYGEIVKYENESGKRVSTIVIYNDSRLTNSNPGVLVIGDCNVRALSRHWSDVNMINALSGRWFTRSENESDINAEYKEYFLSQSWDSFSKEQLIFDGSTLHLCIY